MSTVTLTREERIETTAEESPVTVKQLLTRARDLVAKGWTQGVLYADGDGEEVELILPEKIEYVCSVGAMRLAFAELVEMEPSGTRVWYDGEEVEYEAPVYDEEAVLAHPLYAAGMKALGRAFFDRWEKREALLDGRRYGIVDVQSAIVDCNDEHFTAKDEIVSAFERAVEAAT